MDPMTMMAIMSGIGMLTGAMKGQQPNMAQAMFPQANRMGAKPPMQVPMLNQVVGNPIQPEQQNPMNPYQNKFSSMLGRYGGLM